jgi:prepilin-type N-terminal cleavage/methylation domain-containing protein
MCRNKRFMDFRKGFSLVELSIVLVVISLLVGAVMGGKVLIDNAKVTSLGRDLELYENRITQFFSDGNIWPGDASNDSGLPKHNLNCQLDSDSVTGTSPYQGNENGIVAFDKYGSSLSESGMVWCHIYLKGIGDYYVPAHSGSGTTLSSNVPVRPGVNIPITKSGIGGYTFYYDNIITNQGAVGTPARTTANQQDSVPGTPNRHVIMVAEPAQASSNYALNTSLESYTGVLTPKQVKSLKQKYDNSLSAFHGGILVSNSQFAANSTNTCVSSDGSLNDDVQKTDCVVRYIIKSVG